MTATATDVPLAEYLEALYEMDEEGIHTQQARLAEWLGDDRKVGFTVEGEAAARTLVRRHRLAERFLVETVKLPWHLAHEEATRWGRAISDAVEERMVELLGDPGTCVHGNPIPGSGNAPDQRGLRPLNEMGSGDRVVLERLTEDLELDLSIMRFFEESGLMPGADIGVVGVAPDGTMTLSVGGENVGLGSHLTDNLWVRKA
jgi:DtxR family transcriptional regulator, Mn-dependent transcriptional regulator